jgi:type IV pilus assembly protein PilE
MTFSRTLRARFQSASTSRDVSTASSKRTGEPLLRDESGYTLTELMIVLVVIGILTLIALPKFMGVATKAKMTEAKTQLNHLHTLQKAHYFERDVYASRLSAVGFEQSPLVTNGGTARYRIEIEDASRAQYVATATAVVDFDNDGTYNVWQVDQSGQITQRTAD